MNSEIIFPNHRLTFLFLCSGECNTEIKYLEFLKNMNINVSRAIFVDRIYGKIGVMETIIEKVKSSLPYIISDIIPSFINLSEFLESTKIKVDLIISFGFQIAYNVNDLGTYYEELWNTACALQNIGNTLYAIRWIKFPENVVDFLKPEIKSGEFLYLFTNEIFEKIPAKFKEDKLLSIAK